MGLLESVGQFMLYYNHYLQKHQPICRKLRLLFNQRVISQTVKIGVSKVHKHIHTLLCPAKLSFFSGRNSIKTTSSSVFHLCINQFQRCPSPPPPPTPTGQPRDICSRWAFASSSSSSSLSLFKHGKIHQALNNIN